MLYLTVFQMLAHFCSHLLMTRTASNIFLMLWILAVASVGGYIIHIGEIPQYLWWSETFSPQRWLLPVIIADEFSHETLENTVGQQLCRNKHVNNECSLILLHLFQLNIFVLFSPHRFKGKKSSFNTHVQYQMEQKS